MTLVIINFFAGHHRRRHLARDQTGGLRLGPGGQEVAADQPGEGQQDGVVVQAGRHGSGDQHQKGSAGKLKVVGPRRGDAIDGREDDVRPEAEGDGVADVRRVEEAGHAQEVHGVASGNGLLQVQVQLKTFISSAKIIITKT